MIKTNSKILIIFNTLLFIRKCIILYFLSGILWSINHNALFHKILFYLYIYSVARGICNIFYENLSFKYIMTEENITIIKGIIFKKKYKVSRNNVISISFDQPFIYRIFNRFICKINIGLNGQESLLIFHMIDLYSKNELEQVLSRKSTEIINSNNTNDEYTIRNKDILKSSFLLSNLMLSVPLAFDVIYRIGLLDNISTYYKRSFKIMVIIIVIIIVITIVIDICHQVYELYNFKATREKDKITISNGIINKTINTFDISHITALVITYSPIGKILGICSAYVYVTNANKNTNFTNKTRLLPYVPYSKLKDALFCFLDERYTNFRLPILLKNIIVNFIYFLLIGIVIISLACFKGVDYLYVLLVVLYFFISKSSVNIKIDENYIIVRKGVLFKNVYVLKKDNILWSIKTQNILQKTLGVCNIKIAVRKNPVKSFRIYNVPVKTKIIG